MSRIREKFVQLKLRGEKGFVPFITAGDPDLETSLEILRRLSKLGSTVIEIGVPFSDPMADGPTIQRSSERALANKISFAAVLELIEEFRKSDETPVCLFSYLNPLLRHGIDNLARQGKRIGIDGLLITDVVGFEAENIGKTLTACDIDLISLVAPTTSDERLNSISNNATGFLYAISRAGVTGEQTSVHKDAKILVKRIRALSDIPVAVGFGISTREQIEEVWDFADAAVVGSAIVSVIENASNAGDVPGEVEDFVGSLLEK